jgi:hypothetical protein
VNQNQRAKEQLKREQDLLAAEREKSENLLLNILPVAIARGYTCGPGHSRCHRFKKIFL